MNGNIFQSLNHKNFKLFFWGQIISVTGTWVQITTIPWLVYRLTNSAFLLGVTGFLSQIFILFLTPFTGAAADHYNKRKVLIITQVFAMVQAIILGVLTISGEIVLWQIFAIVSVLGIINAFDMPARQSFLVEMVGKQDLMNAIGLNSFIFNAARVIGPAIAGLLILWVGEGMCFLLNGISFLAIILPLLFINLPKTQINNNGDITIKKKLISGIKYILSSKKISSILFLLSITGLTAVFPMTLMPIFARDIYKLGAFGLGLFMAVMGIGALVGTLSIAAKRSSEGLEKIILLSAISFGLISIFFGLVRNVFGAVLLLIIAGYSVSIQLGLSNTFMQLKTPDEMRGRVMGFFIMAFMGFAPLGSLLAGFIAHRFSAPTTIIVGGILIIVSSVILQKRIMADETFMSTC